MEQPCGVRRYFLTGDPNPGRYEQTVRSSVLSSRIWHPMCGSCRKRDGLPKSRAFSTGKLLYQSYTHPRRRPTAANPAPLDPRRPRTDESSQPPPLHSAKLTHPTPNQSPAPPYFAYATPPSTARESRLR